MSDGKRDGGEPLEGELDGEDRLDEATAERGRKIVRVVILLVLLGAGIGIAARYWKKDEKKEEVVHDATAPVAPPSSGPRPPSVRFTDITDDVGLTFTHTNGARGKKLLPETMGAGAAFFDYDNDGDPDLFLVNSDRWPDDADTSSRPTQALYRNDAGRFTDVTKEAGLDVTFYGMGASVGDYDGDGFADLYVTAVGDNRLFRNIGGERFEDVTNKTGAGGGSSWSTSAVFLDFDVDGDLDIFYVNYVTWSAKYDLEQTFTLDGKGRAYGPPKGFQGEFCHLLRNDGGRFVDVSAQAGVEVKSPLTDVPMAKALGVAVTELNGDGRPDLLVANDTVKNFAFLSRADGTFEEASERLGIAYDDMGNARGAMGIAVADYRNDGSTAVAIGNFANEMSALFVAENPQSPTFNDDAMIAGIGAATRNALTFGMTFVDYDLDGHQDLIAANGHVEPEIDITQPSQEHAQSADLFWNAGASHPGRLVEVTAKEAGPDLFHKMVGRALCVADIDGDLDLDVLITANGGRARLFRNEQSANKALRLDLRTTDGKRAALGARVTLKTSAGVQRRYLGGGTSYLGENELLLTFGLGTDAAATEIVVTWPDGATRTIERLAAGRHVVRQGRP